MNSGAMGGFLSKCKCRSNSRTSNSTDNHREDSLKSLPSTKDEAYEPEFQSQEHVKKKSLGKDFNSFTVPETLNSFRLQNQWTDFMIGVNGNHFPVHKNVLAASCKFFMEVFSACEDDYYEFNKRGTLCLRRRSNFSLHWKVCAAWAECCFSTQSCMVVWFTRFAKSFRKISFLSRKEMPHLSHDICIWWRIHFASNPGISSSGIVLWRHFDHQ